MSGVSPTFQYLRSEFAQAILACRANPTKRAVHALRTATRRLEALLRKVLEDHPGAAGLHHQARKLLKELKRIRKMSGPVRDLDVYRKLTAILKDEILSRKSTGPHDSVTRESERLDHHLKRKHKHTIKILRQGLTKCELRIGRILERTSNEIAGLTAASPSPLTTAGHWLRRSSFQLAQLDEDNLHNYRKQTKAARYVAELQETSPAAQRFARRLQRAQDAIGKWHDWDTLAQQAKDILGKHTPTVGLLKKKRNRALNTALRIATADIA
jgi:CHAD domain-containing protein